MITVPYVCRMSFSDKLAGDLDGRAKLILDWMVSRSLTPDDRHCWGLFLDKNADVPTKTVLIEVEPYVGSRMPSRARAA